ncbi:MAG: NUDIX domain-containing protein [Ruminococcus sp.]|nr:NUDIX domain-containing protein [Ruminococcus sp.]
MEVNNALYKKQGIHVIASIFTVDKGVTKVLLVKRKNLPFKDMWSLVGGALYNNEDLLYGLNREIFEKTGILNIDTYFSGVFGKKDRSPVMRMVAITYIGVIDSNKVSFLKETLRTSNADWFPIDKIPKLAFDHNEIVKQALSSLQEMISNTDILKALFPNGFTLPEIQEVYESILGKKFDRRNFRKKILSIDLIQDTNKVRNFKGNKPAKVYKFQKRKINKNVF